VKMNTGYNNGLWVKLLMYQKAGHIPVS